MLEICPAESHAGFQMEAWLAFGARIPLFSATSSKPFRLISLHKMQFQLLWNDILAKKPGVGWVASTKGLTLRLRADKTGFTDGKLCGMSSCRMGKHKSPRMSRSEFIRLKPALESALPENLRVGARGTATLGCARQQQMHALVAQPLRSSAKAGVCVRRH